MKSKILLTSLVAMLSVGSAFADTYVTASSSCDTEVLGATNVGNKAATIEADWAINTYNIRYNNMTGATNHVNNPATYNIEQTPITLSNPTKVGYDFDGWFENASLAPETAVTTLSSNNLPSPDEDGAYKDLWAKWDLHTYNCAAGTYLNTATGECVSCPAGSSCTGGNQDVEHDPIITECTGNTYSAAGASSCTACAAGYTANGAHTECTADGITLTWTVDGQPADGGAATCTYDETIGTLPTQPTKPGYHFVGWKVKTETDTQTEP